MVLSIATDLTQFRHDSERLPLITVTDGLRSWLKLADWTYYEVPEEFELFPPNRSRVACPLVVRNLLSPTWVTDTGITQTADGIQRSAIGSGWLGAYYDTELSPDSCSIQAKILFAYPCGISLQDSAVARSHNYDAIDEVAHCMIFGHEGQGRIQENGSLVPYNRYFKYEENDIGMIELIDGVVRYYLVKPDSTMILLRTTRSKITENPIAEVMVFQPEAAFDDVFVHNNSEAATSMELIGVLENFQDWQNDFAYISTSESIEMADKNVQFTFPNHKKQLRTLNAALAMRTNDERNDFIDFYAYHGNEIPYIFVDNAHKDRNRVGTEFWAKFASPFGDRVRSSCLSSHQATIVEDYRDDYIPKYLDDTPPSTPVLVATLPSEDAVLLEWDFVSDNVVAYELSVGSSGFSGTVWGSPFEITDQLHNSYFYPIWGEFIFYRIRARDRAGRYSDWSNIEGGFTEVTTPTVIDGGGPADEYTDSYDGGGPADEFTDFYDGGTP